MRETGSGSIRILLVEDSEIDAELLSGHLAKADLNVAIERVVDRQNFIDSLNRGGFDVILADYSLPDFDGLAALNLAREHAPDTPFIFVSGVIGEEFATNALRRGATDYILKRNLSRVPTSIDRALAEANQRAERHKAEAALRKSEQDLQNALVAGRFGTWTLDLVTGDFKTSSTCRTNFGRDPELPFAYEDLRSAVHPDDQPRMQAAVEKSILTRCDYDIEYRLKTPNGNIRWVAIRGQTTYADDGTPLTMSGVSGDVTQRKQLEEELLSLNETLERRVEERTAELLQAQEALRQSQKMEAIGQLTGGIAHDFNNLLTGITGSLDLIRRRLDTGRTDGIDRFMDAASASAQRAASLTHRLLAFARRQSLHTKSQDVNALVRGIDDMLRRTLGENMVLETELPNDLWPALTDGHQLENALLNLAINARDAMPDGGTLTIETSVTTTDEITALRDEARAGDYVVVTVSDTGTGMTADVLAKAFDPFFTTKPIGQGTGLGLSMIYGFAKQSGGYVRLESRLGLGTSVRIYLPRAVEIIADGPRKPDAPPLDGKGETVLIVEDDETVRLLIAEVLQELGYRYWEAEDAAKALPLLESDMPIDLLVTDVGLPNMNGRQLAELARQHRPNLKILFVTGYAESAAARAGFFEPGMDMMTKPFALDALGTKIRQLIETETSI